MTTQLKKCPFCGGEPILHHIEPHSHKLTFNGHLIMDDYPGAWTIECCDIGMIKDTREEAIAAWNRRTEPAGSAEVEHVRADVRADVRANDIDDRYAGRLALLLECMLIDSNRYWNEAANLLDEYKAEWDSVNPQPPLFMGEQMPPERKARILALKAESGSE